MPPTVVDCIVFWSKNPAPMLEKPDKLREYNYYFQFILNSYGSDIENNLPSISKRIDDKLVERYTILKVCNMYGKEVRI